MPSPKKPSRLGAAGLAVLSLAALPTAVYAFDDKIESDIKHVIECLTWMVNDPPRYIANCTPSRPREVMETSVTNKPRPSSSVSSSEPSSSSSEEPPPPANSSSEPPPSSSSEPPPASSSEPPPSSSSEEPPPSSSQPPPSSSQPPPSSSEPEEEPSCEGDQCLPSCGQVECPMPA